MQIKHRSMVLASGKVLNTAKTKTVCSDVKHPNLLKGLLNMKKNPFASVQKTVHVEYIRIFKKYCSVFPLFKKLFKFDSKLQEKKNHPDYCFTFTKPTYIQCRGSIFQKSCSELDPKRSSLLNLA